MIGFREILIIALIIVLLFGARRIPQLMGDFAKGIKSFRQGLSDDAEEKAKTDEPPPKRITHAAGAEQNSGVKQSES